PPPPFISVIMPAYNVEKYIEKSIRAVLAQTYRHFELIVIDDGSKDNTGKIIQKLALEDSRIKFIENKNNKGIVCTLNMVVSQVKGDYIARMDADDMAYPFWLDTIVSWMEEKLDVLICGSAMKVHAVNSILEVPETNLDITRKFFINCPMLHPTVLIRPKVFKEFGLKYDDYKHAEDYKLWFEISKKGKLANLSMPLVEYRVHDTQVSRTYSNEQRNTANRIRKEVWAYYLPILYPSLKIELNLTFDDARKLYDYFRPIYSQMEVKEKEFIQEIIYMYYMSLIQYRWVDLLKFIKMSPKEILSRRQVKKIIKKFIRSQKYKPFL
ncbi:glycosyltransferase family 2 protein, partial [Basilea psittacipulmonis]